MRIHSDYEKCVVCFENNADSWEHILPKILGGILEAGILCKACNSQFGAALDYQVNQDPRFRLAVEALRDQIPEFYHVFNNRNSYIGTDTDGPPIKMSLRANRKFRLHAKLLEDGSILKDTKESRKELKCELKKQGYDADKINSILVGFDNAPNGHRFELYPGVEITKRDVTTIQPLIGGRLVSDRVIAKIAYMHFCICITPELILSNSKRFKIVADHILGGDKPEFLDIQYRLGPKYQPHHVFRVVCEEDRTILKFLFFGAIEFSVALLNIVIMNSEYPIIIHDIKSSSLYVSQNWEEFQKRNVFPVSTQQLPV